MPDPKVPTIEEHNALKSQLAELSAKLETLKAAPPVALSPAAPNGEHDLDTYDKGEFKHTATGKPFKLKIVSDDEQGRKFHLKSKEGFFHAATVGEVQDHFHGDFSTFEPKKPEGASK